MNGARAPPRRLTWLGGRHRASTGPPRRAFQTLSPRDRRSSALETGGGLQNCDRGGTDESFRTSLRSWRPAGPATDSHTSREGWALQRETTREDFYRRLSARFGGVVAVVTGPGPRLPASPFGVEIEESVSEGERERSGRLGRFRRYGAIERPATRFPNSRRTRHRRRSSPPRRRSFRPSHGSRSPCLRCPTSQSPNRRPRP